MEEGGVRGPPSRLMRPDTVVVLYFMTIMAPWAATTTESYAVLSATRSVLAGFLVLGLAFVLHRRILMRNWSTLFGWLAVFFGFGLLIAAASGAASLLTISDIGAIGLTIIGCLVFFEQADNLNAKRLLWPMVAFSVFVLAVSFRTGGMKLGFPLRLELSYAEADYTLSGAAFWSLSAIFAFALAAIERGVFLKSILILHACFSVLASASFGARGESIALFLVLAAWLLRRSKAAFAVGCIGAYFFLKFGVNSGAVEAFTLYTRLLEVQSGYYGIRDQLLVEAAHLIADKPWCLLSGCGFAFFQFSQGYPYGLYIHNQFVELVISFGVPISSVFIAMVGLGAWRMRYSPVFNGFLLYVLAFAGITALKSGSIEGSVILIPLCFFCIANFNAAPKPNSSRVYRRLDRRQSLYS